MKVSDREGLRLGLAAYVEKGSTSRPHHQILIRTTELPHPYAVGPFGSLHRLWERGSVTVLRFPSMSAIAAVTLSCSNLTDRVSTD